MLYEHGKDWTLEYISPRAEQGRSRGGSLLCEATSIIAARQVACANAQIREPVNRKERAEYNELVRDNEEPFLRDFFSDAGYFLSSEDFLRAFADRKIGEGAEQQVYLSYDGIHVIKTNDAIMHGSWLEFFNRIALHNWLFPEVAYLLTGFTETKGRLAAIIQQPFLQSVQGATRVEVQFDMEKRGFERVKNDDYYSADLGIIVEDLHDENVLVSDTGALLYFDPVVYLETAEMSLAGKLVYRFPFN